MMGIRLYVIRILVLALAQTLLLTSAFTQSPQKKRPKIKDFGSSLKRLRWDPLRNGSVPDRSRTGSTAKSDEDDVVRIETNLVTCDVLVVDRHGTIVSGLTANDFTITDDGEPQQVIHFLLGDNISVPRTIVLIIDYSGSQSPYLRNSIDAAKLLVDKLSARDRMAIVTDDVELLVDFTDDKQKLKKKLESLIDRTKTDRALFGFGSPRRFGKSAQYSALMATLNEAFIEEDLRPIIIFQTDGDELYNLRNAIITPTTPPDLPDDLKAESLEGLAQRMQFINEHLADFSLADLYRAVDQSRATIYTVIPGFQLLGRNPEEQLSQMRKDVEIRMLGLSRARREQLKTIQAQWRVFSTANLTARANDALKVQTALAAVAPRTGGWTEFLETPEQAEGIYTRILADINQRYIIGYYPTSKEQDGKRHRIKIEVRDHPEYHILGRSFYYAPGSK